MAIRGLRAGKRPAQRRLDRGVELRALAAEIGKQRFHLVEFVRHCNFSDCDFTSSLLKNSEWM
jgi:hypothetical protein